MWHVPYVVEGALGENGMISFKNTLKVEDAEAIRSFLTARANELKRNPRPTPGAGGPGGAAPAGPPPGAVGALTPAHQ